MSRRIVTAAPAAVLAKGGPIRLIFTASSAFAANTDNWTWSLASVQARG
jgi:hypothetical protein